MSAPAVAVADSAAEYPPPSSPAKASAASPKPASSSWAPSTKPTSGPASRKPANAKANSLSKPTEFGEANVEPALDAGVDSPQPGPDAVATQPSDEKPSEETKPSEPSPPSSGRTLVLCFDGTAMEFNPFVTNVVRFFGALDKDDTSKQICYYQPGIGCYSPPSILSPITAALAQGLDLATAWYIGGHITSGYQFIAENWMPGDKICLFGFSRGAYTARALAGMLEKVGLMEKGNLESTPMAYRTYRLWNPELPITVEAAASFKKRFSRDVIIDFVGVWETVGSIGYIGGPHLPFADRSIRIFRQAMALDEQRVKFPLSYYHVPAAQPEPKQKAGERFDRELRDPAVADARDDTGGLDKVREVWFAGSHSDVGGGSRSNDKDTGLANITLDWMIRHCEFASEYAGIPIKFKPSLQPFEVVVKGIDTDIFVPIKNELWNFKSPWGNWSIFATLLTLWWIFLEFLPFKQTYQTDYSDKWHTTYWPHLGKPRFVFNQALVHISVLEKQKRTEYRPMPKLDTKNVQYVEN